MKKVIIILVMTLMMFVPFKVYADDVYISKYYIDATIEKNGDVTIKEMFVLSGQYNGALKELYYNGSVGAYGPSDFYGSSIYFGDGVVLKEIKEIPIDRDINFSYINNKGIAFTKVNIANNGSKHLYTVETIYGGYRYKLYNQNSSGEKAFYLEYTVKNLAVKHGDIGELWMNVLTNNPDLVRNFEMYIHVPDNKQELRVWAHGPLTGYIEKINATTVKVTIDTLYSGYSMDVRLAFDRDVIADSIKTTKYDDALDQIVDVETLWADEANIEREKVIEILKEQDRKGVTNSIINGVVILMVLIYIVYVYFKHDKEYKAVFNQKYYRDFPSEDTPPTVGYLIRGNVNNDDLSASILYLIYKKVIIFEAVNKNDYSLTLTSRDGLSGEDKLLIDFIFHDSDNVTLKELKRRAKVKYQSFISRYTAWVNAVREVAKGKGFYERKDGPKLIGFLLSIVLIVMPNIMEYTISWLTGLSVITGIGSFIYFICFSRRSKKGLEQYNMWKALKNFMLDFGRMAEKELPEVILWEKYLVYALTLGCADKLSKQMKIKIEEMNVDTIGTGNIMFDYYRFQALTTFTAQINSAVTSVVKEAYSAQAIANSSSSSGSGGGGGFSSGGGFSGGGGGSTGHF